MEEYDALSLFSGGLDSILASRLMQSLGYKILGLHFVSPFFGKPEQIPHWTREYGLPIVSVDVGQEFVDLMAGFPGHGFGKVLNPCVDCKILMLRRAKALLPAYGAKFLISGEVLGQRPMSQRADTLNTIRNDAEVRGLLLRPLSARLLPPTPMEESGLVDREKLYAINGRGRRGQFGLAKILGVTSIPAQAGGCRLSEKESARRYWPLLRAFSRPLAGDFELANVGRQLWKREGGAAYWLTMGRDRQSNERVLALARPGDYLLEARDFPGPQGLCRPAPGSFWPEHALREAAACLASFSSKARQHGQPAMVLVRRGEEEREFSVDPAAPHGFAENLSWEWTREERNVWIRNVTAADGVM